MLLLLFRFKLPRTGKIKKAKEHQCQQYKANNRVFIKLHITLKFEWAKVTPLDKL